METQDRETRVRVGGEREHGGVELVGVEGVGELLVEAVPGVELEEVGGLEFVEWLDAGRSGVR